MKNIFLLLAINLFISISVKSQITYENRIEIDLKDDYDIGETTEFGKQGFIMTSSKKDLQKNEIEWKFEKYNTDLKLVDTKSVFLDDKFYINETFKNDERLHFLFRDRKKEDFSIITIESSDMKVTQVNGVLPKKSQVKDMSVLGDYAFFSIVMKKSPFIYAVNWKTGEKNLTPILIDNIKPKKTSIMNFQVLKSSDEILAYVKAKVSYEKSDIYVIRLNRKGSKEHAFNLTKNVEENFSSISALKLDKDKYIYTGTYSTEYTNLSEGLFVCQTEGDDISFIKFYNFLDLNNFLSYLPEKRQERIEKRKEKKNKKGKELKINYKIASHEVITLDDGYLFLGEAYYSTYRTETYLATTTVNGVTTTTTQTRQVFDGYQYTHAVLAKFDKNGNLLWDQTFEMWPVEKPFYEKRFISIAAKDQNSIKLVFISHNQLNSKSIDFSGSVLQDTQSEEIQTNFEGDKVKRSFSKINHWYENYFIAYGEQKIKNNEDKKNTKRKRNVYFINKIKYEN
jgi:hypothetical protein